MAILAPFGFQSGQSRRSVNEYYVPASDTAVYAVGDVVKTNGNVFTGRLPDSRVANAMLHVTKAVSGDAIRGVIVGIVAGPDDNSLQSLPATKRRAYCLLVNDNPQALWDVQADNTAILSVMGGMYANYTVGAPSGSVSSTRVASSTIGTTVRDLLIVEVLKNDGANSLLRVAFVQHEMAAAGASPTIAAALQSLVSDARITTWANRSALVTLGLTSAFFTDVGVGGSFWFYAGGRWRPSSGRVILKNLTTDISNNGAPKIVMDYATLPAGLVQDGDRLRTRIAKERTGGTSDTDATDVMLGAAPTTLGTTLNLTTSALATTAIQLAVEWEWRRISATSLRTQLVPGATGSGTSASASSLITGLTNMDTTDSYLQVTSDLTTAGGEVVWLRGFMVELIAGA